LYASPDLLFAVNLGFAQDGKNKPTFSVDLDPFLSGFNV